MELIIVPFLDVNIYRGVIVTLRGPESRILSLDLTNDSFPRLAVSVQLMHSH
jgi:hypothetical protein